MNFRGGGEILSPIKLTIMTTDEIKKKLGFSGRQIELLAELETLMKDIREAGITLLYDWDKEGVYAFSNSKMEQWEVCYEDNDEDGPYECVIDPSMLLRLDCDIQHYGREYYLFANFIH